MIKRFSLFVIATGMFCAFSGYGQESPAPVVMTPDSLLPKPVFGVKAGANVQTITGNDWVRANNAGFTGGFFFGLHKNKVGVRAEILVNTTSYKSKYSMDSAGNIGDFNIAALQIPLMFEYQVIPWLSVQVGPQYTSILAVSKNAPFDADPKVMFTSGEFSAVLGVEGKLPYHLVVGGRYIYGLSNINNHSAISNGTSIISDEAWYNRSAQIYVGYTFK